MSSDGDKKTARVAAAVERLLGGLAVYAFRRPIQALLIVAALTALSLVYASRLTVNADLAELLPKTFPSVRSLDAMKQRFGGLGYVTVVARDAEPEQLRRFADDLAPRLAALPEIRYVDHRRPAEFFEERALYFLELGDLEEIEQRLAEREAYEKRAANPLYMDLEEEGPPPLSFDEFTAKYKRRGDTSWMAAQLGETHYIDTKAKIIAVLAKPAAMAFDLHASRDIIAKTQRVLDGMDLAAYGPGLRVELGGSYKKKVDQQDLIQRDLSISTIVAFALIFAFLAFHFRRISAIALVLVPLGVGLLWSYGFAGATFSTLNILTGFIGAILSGMGIENGIHLLGRFEAEWPTTDDPLVIMRRTFGNTGRGVAVTAVTTAVAFGGLSLSEFRAFREFGVLAAAGMMLFVLAYGITLPALLSLATRLGWRPRDVRNEPISPYVPWLMQRARILFAVSLLALVGLTALMPRVSFNYNFRSLLSSNLRSFELDRTIDRLLGYSQSPVVVLTETLDDERQVARVLRERHEQLGERSTIQFIASSADMVPGEQPDKSIVIDRIGKILAKVDPERLAPKDRRAFDLVARMTQARPFTREALPDEVTRQFHGVDAQRGAGFVLIYAAIDLSDGAKVRDFAREVRAIPMPSNGEEAPIAGEAMVLADIFTMVADEAAPVLAFAVGLVFITLWLLIGNLRSAFACIVPAAASLIATLGLMPLADLQLNYINIVMIPLFFGIGVDGGAHLTTRMDLGEAFDHVFNETGRGVTGSLLTNAFGFLALVVADHSGLNSLGEMALIGLGANLLACNVALPAFVAWRLAVGAKGSTAAEEEPAAEVVRRAR